jgi:hypothetical protein
MSRLYEHPIAAVERLARLAGEHAAASEGDGENGESHGAPLPEVRVIYRDLCGSAK